VSTTTNIELRCSTQTSERGVDPTGTATYHDALVVVEVALPWPSSVTDLPVLADVVAASEAAGGEVSVYGVVPEHDDPDRHRVVVYRRGEGGFRSFTRHEAMATTAELGATTAALLGDHPPVPDDDVVADLLVCTHGRRDRCCGSFGTNLYTAIGAAHVRAGVRTWRVSHTGGHRFAPTAILLPQGTTWAWLDTDLVDRVLHRRGDLADLLPHYRGSCAIGAPPVQVAEREAFRLEGWSWLDTDRSGSVVAQDGDRFEVRLDVRRPDGSTGAYVATVDRVGTIPQPICGEPLDDVGNGKTDSLWSVASFEPANP
jgi:hypothetical protein